MSRFFIPLFIVMCAAFFVALRLNEAVSGQDKSASPPVSEDVQINTFRPEAPGPRAAVLKRREDGHFWADARVDDIQVRFMVDTGAKSVALSRTDALRLGIEQKDLTFDVKVLTAGGETRGALVMLDEIRIGSVAVRDVGALVLETPHLQQSLLGMSFLSELQSYEVRGTTMIIRGK